MRRRQFVLARISKLNTRQVKKDMLICKPRFHQVKVNQMKK